MSLKKIAAKMHVDALKSGRSFRRLQGGLCLTLYYRPSPKDDIVLKLARPKVQPSDTEIKVCVINFFGNREITNCVQKGLGGEISRNIIRNSTTYTLSHPLNAVYLGIARISFYGKAA